MVQNTGYWFRSATAPDPAESPGLSRGPDPAVASPGSTGGPEQREQTPAVPPPSNPPKLEYGVMTPAERYVTLYPDRAAAILAAGGLPACLAFPPPDPEVITELLAGNSPVVRTFRQADKPVAA